MSTDELLELEFILEDDFESILKLNKTVHDVHFQNHPDIFNPYHPEKFKPWFKNFIKKDNSISILVKKNEKYIGYALIIHKKKSDNNPFTVSSFESFYIDQISIEKEYQNKGIGRKLIEYIKTIAIKRGVNKIQLDVWNKNFLAKDFFMKNQFKTIREIMEIQIE